jgi:hypothetical protein
VRVAPTSRHNNLRRIKSRPAARALPRPAPPHLSKCGVHNQPASTSALAVGRAHEHEHVAQLPEAAACATAAAASRGAPGTAARAAAGGSAADCGAQRDLVTDGGEACGERDSVDWRGGILLQQCALEAADITEELGPWGMMGAGRGRGGDERGGMGERRLGVDEGGGRR